jgi:hypothetical protein
VGCKQDPKKPIVFETYEELVFSEPHPELYSRLKNRIPGGGRASSSLLSLFSFCSSPAAFFVTCLLLASH